MNTTIISLIAAFGGGAFAASIGALPAFIMTGVFAVIGAIVSMFNPAIGGVIVGQIAFGSFFGPHIAFAGGVAAAAYAKKKGILESGSDIVTSLGGLTDASVILVGGVFGVIGCALMNFVVAPIFSHGIITDNPGFIVFFSGLLVRLVFGGKVRTGDKVISQGAALTHTITLGITYSLMVGGVFLAIATSVPKEVLDAVSANYAVLAFGIAAIGLIFAEMGQGYIGCHHIVIISAHATVNSYAKFGGNAIAALAMGVIFGTLAAIICDVETNLINSGTDSHIDGPGFTIALLTTVQALLFL